MKKRILSLLLVLVMLLSLLPVGVLAADGETVSVTLSGLHSAQVNSLKLHTYNEGVKGEADLLDEKAAADSKYVVDLAPGAYWVEGYDANGDCNGGVAISVDADHSSFEFKRIYEISVSPSSWVKDTDYTLSMRVADASGTERSMAPGIANNYGTQSTSFLFVLGDTVSVTATPNAEKHANYNAVTVSKTPTSNENIKLACKEAVTLKVTAPTGSILSAGEFSTYTSYDFVAPTSVETTDAGVVATFRLSMVDSDSYLNYHHHFLRVQHPDGVTYWTFGKWNTGKEVTVTAKDLHIGDNAVTKNTVYPNFEKNIFDVGNLYLNINSQGYLNLTQGASKQLYVFRNWQAIESYQNTEIALPDVHYTVLDAQNPAQTSDVVEIVPNENNSSSAVMTAKRAGTAIVLVTYDAMTHTSGQSSSDSKIFSANWPELTGVFVVSVDQDGTSVKTNMTLDRVTSAPTILDAEHDFLYYTGDAGASYSFKPKDGCEVSVLRSSVSQTAMTFSGGFTQNGVTTAEDGTVTVSGLTTGRHIIKVTKDSLSTYQVVSARKASYTLQSEDGTTLDLTQIKAGSKVKIQFSGLLNPKEKLSGIYNSTPYIALSGEDGTQFKSATVGGFGGTYDFSGDSAKQVVTVTIPKYWSEESYTLTGMICAPKQFGSPTGSHRGSFYGGTGINGYTAPAIGDNLSYLPLISIPVAKTDFLTGTLVFKNEAGNPIDRTALTVTLKDSAGNAIAVADDGTFKAYAEEYFYTISAAGIEYATGSVKMEETASNSFTCTLTKTAEGAWDGTTKTEPKKDGDGVYQIGTGAELAWFVDKSATAAVSGKLTADINLSKYVWLNVQSSNAVTLNGAGHTITGLNAAFGLFKQIGANSNIHDLTVRGTINGTGSAGAITSYAGGTNVTITNCTSYVVITSTGTNVGGIVGYVNLASRIENCANHGAVTGGSSVGGIIGGFNNNRNVISGCYNTAAVTATGSKAGGIFGGSGYGFTVENCYNTGDISGETSGGIGGEAKGETHWSTGATVTPAQISSCYSTGVAGSGAFGTVHTASVNISKCYYLNTRAADKNAEALSDADLKDADLSDAFGAVCNGYPALKWQNVTFHKAGESTKVDALCEAKGYTRYTCNECHEEYRAAYTPALGHDFCTDAEGCDDCVLTAPTCTQPGKIVRACRRDGCSEKKEDVVPAKGHTPKAGSEQVFTGYTIYTCDVCNAEYTVWDDDRISHVSYPEQTVTSISVSDSGNFPWVYNADLNRFESSNQEQNNTASATSFVFTLSAPTVLRFDYGVSSEQKYDKLTITLTKDGGDPQALADGISGEESGSVDQKLEAGRYTLTFSYSKDSSGKNGSDMAYVSVLTLAGMARVIVENTTFPESEGAAWYGVLADEWIELAEDSTMMSCVVEALNGRTVVGAESNYITAIDGLCANDAAAGSMSGWMGTLNDWFTNTGFAGLTVALGTLHAGDEIRIMYTRTANDLGGDWYSSDTRLKALTCSAGKLTPKFSGDGFAYTLTVPEGTTSLLVTPTAANKNYQVRTYLGTQADGREYTRTSQIPIENGSVITVVCADDSWPTMNEKSDGKRTYTITVEYGVVKKSEDASVSSVTVAGVEAQAGADNQYTVTVPYGTNVTADSFVIVPHHADASVGALTQNENVWSFTVTAEDSIVSAVYTVTVMTALPPYIGPVSGGSKPSTDTRLPFADVSRTSWFYADAAFVYEKGLFSGTDSSTFSPDASMTRAMLVTVLYRLEGQPVVTGSSSFADVKSGVYYENAVIWAADNGIVTGTGSSSFSPDEKVTREQLAAILYRYAQYRKLDTSADAKLDSFSDAGNVSAYARTALGWAVAEGLVNGASGKLMPKGSATRAQVAAIFHRFVENVMI